MPSKRRIYISAPYQSVLSERHGQLKIAVLKYLESQGMGPQHFLESGIPVSTLRSRLCRVQKATLSAVEDPGVSRTAEHVCSGSEARFCGDEEARVFGTIPQCIATLPPPTDYE